MISVCPECGAELASAVDAVEHYERMGGSAPGSWCEKRQRRHEQIEQLQKGQDMKLRTGSRAGLGVSAVHADRIPAGFARTLRIAYRELRREGVSPTVAVIGFS